AASRQEVVAPFLGAFVVQTNLRPGHSASTTGTISSFFGANLFSAIFLSSSLHNFILLGLLWAQDQERFQWVGWLQAAAVPGLVMLFGFLLAMAFFLNCTEKPI